jgi:hypothetical protein
MSVELEEFEKGRWRVKREVYDWQKNKSSLPVPFVISDIMDPVEQVDGRFYTSKRAFRAVGKALGLTEVGNEKPKPRVRPSQSRAATEARRASLRKAIEQVRAGNVNHKTRSGRP